MGWLSNASVLLLGAFVVILASYNLHVLNQLPTSDTPTCNGLPVDQIKTAKTLNIIFLILAIIIVITFFVIKYRTQYCGPMTQARCCAMPRAPTCKPTCTPTCASATPAVIVNGGSNPIAGDIPATATAASVNAANVAAAETGGA